jgi:hypothetical protein
MGAWERYGAPPSQTDREYWERCSTNQTDRQNTITDRQKVAGFAILISAAENIGALNNVTAGTEQWNEAQRSMISNVLRI